MNCIRCNTPWQEGAKFCVKCGLPLKAQMNLSQQQPAQNNYSTGYQPTQNDYSGGYPTAQNGYSYEQQPQVYPPQHTDYGYGAAQKPPKKTGLIIGLVAAIVVLVGVIIAAVLILNNNDGKKNSNSHVTKETQERETAKRRPLESVAEETIDQSLDETKDPLEETKDIAIEETKEDASVGTSTVQFSEFEFTDAQWAQLQYTAAELFNVIGRERLNAEGVFDVSQMSLNELGAFAHNYLMNSRYNEMKTVFAQDEEFISQIGMEYQAYDETVVLDLIYSAFGIEPDGILTHTYSYDGNTYENMFYEDGHYYWMQADGAPIPCARIHSAVKAGNIIRTEVEIISISNVGTFSDGMYRVEWQQDSSSQMGYTLKSMEAMTDISAYMIGVSTTSTLSSDNNRYAAKNLMDKDTNTAWVEGSSGYGIGDVIEVFFDEEYTVHGIKLANGYWKNWNTYIENAKLKKVRLTFSDGTSFDVQLGDYDKAYGSTMEPCGVSNLDVVTDSDWDYAKYNLDFISFGKGIRTTYVQITILEVTPGTMYEDTCVSEIVPY